MLPPAVPSSLLLPGHLLPNQFQLSQQQAHYHFQQRHPVWLPMVVLPPLRSKQLGEAVGEASPCRVDGEASPTSCSTPSHKGSLSFILSAEVEPDVPRRPSRPKKRAAPASAVEDAAKPPAAPPAKKKLKKGSKFCSVEGCESRAKHARKCWKHGGSVKCKVPDCANRAKSKGVCWSHGGGTVCAFSDCETISVSNGFCWAHGGGKRCSVPHCSKPAYERTHNLCGAHFRAEKDKKRLEAAAEQQ